MLQWYKASYPKLLASLSVRLRNLHLAEDAIAEASARWLSQDPKPSNPVAWVYRAALNHAIDQLRASNKHESLALAEDIAAESEVPDQRLALIFLCAHPSLSADSQAMLMLRYAVGLEINEIAHWFAQDADSVRRRLHRAREKLESTRARFDLPPPSEWVERLPPVLATLEVLYDQSYSNIAGGTEVDGFAREAEQLVLQLSDQLPNEPEVLGLSALIVLAEARRPARLNSAGAFVPLDQQDCHRWDGARIAFAANMLSRAAVLLKNTGVLAGSYLLRAMISAQHCMRKQTGQTPWRAISELYSALLTIEPSVQAQVGFALVEEKLKGAKHALTLLANLPSKNLAVSLAKAHLSEQTGDQPAAKKHYQDAICMPMGVAERRFVEGKLGSLEKLA